MSRLPVQARGQLTEPKQETYDKLTDNLADIFGVNGSKFVYKDENGAFIGPFPAWIAAPTAGIPSMELIINLAKLPLPADAKETAILIAGSHFKPPYELYAHGKVALSVGVTQRQVDQISAGHKPEDLNAGCSAAFDASLYLSTTPGPLPQTLWDA